MSSSEFVRNLSRILDRHGAESLCVHTDLLPFGPLDGARKRSEMSRLFASAILQALDGRPALFPTFNYDYTKTRLYNVDSDSCQVGALNEYVRTQEKSCRTRTPVFNFCVLNDAQALFPMKAADDPFGENSTFAHMRRSKTWLCFLGSTFGGSITAIHHVEQAVGIGYRYRKPFPGTIVLGGQKQPVDFSFHVRVLDAAMPAPDHKRGERELLEAGVLHRDAIGTGEVLMMRMDEYFDYWSARLKENELHCFSPEGQVRVRQMFEKYGYPFTLEMFEAPR